MLRRAVIHAPISLYPGTSQGARSALPDLVLHSHEPYFMDPFEHVPTSNTPRDELRQNCKPAVLRSLLLLSKDLHAYDFCSVAMTAREKEMMQ